MRRIEPIAWGLGAMALVAAGLAALAAGLDAALRAYLAAYVFWVGLGVGALVVAMIHRLTGGAWGRAVAGPLEAAIGTLPLLLIAFLPVALGVERLYPWAGTATEEARQPAYLNVPFFLVRAAVYLLMWCALALLLRGWARADDGAREPGAPGRLRRLSAGGLVALGLTVTFAAVDWVMSLEPHWHSSIYGVMVGMGWILAGFAFALAVTLALAGARPALAAALAGRVPLDLGNLLLAFVVLWTYLAFSQLLIVYAGDVPEEAVWYARRLRGGWGWVAAFLVIAQFLVPLFALLSRAVKRSRGALAALAWLVVLVQMVAVSWLVLPAFPDGAVAAAGLLALTVTGLGGLWVGLFLRLLRQRPAPLVAAWSGHG